MNLNCIFRPIIHQMEFMTENEKKEEKGTKIERSSEKKKLESIVEGLLIKFK